MLISKIGEFGLIERFRKEIKTDASVIRGSGDDCAVIEFNQNEYLLFTCDTVVEGVDFIKETPAYLIGRKSLAVCLSDIAACAGIPRYALVSMGIPAHTPLKKIDKIFQGLSDLAKEYRINIVGGDISKAKQLFIDVSILGLVEKDYLVLRNGAKRGDIIFVSAKLGGSIYGKHLKFTPRIKEARFLVKNFKINSMIDISDSLIQDLGHILKQSRTGALLYEELIPLSKQAHNLSEALYGGEDFELLFTLSLKQARRLTSLKRKFPFWPIGEIREKRYGLKLFNKKGKEEALKIKGFQHF